MEIDVEQIKELYETVENVWPKDDMWHTYSKRKIESFLMKQAWQQSDYILNAGSGGNNYGLNLNMHHRDIAKNKIEQFDDYSVGSIEYLPFKNETFDKIICVGSVINYCDAAAVIAEFARTIKPNGILFLEFESSWGYEHRKKPYYMQPATVVKLKYFNEMWTQWIYSPAYIMNLLKSNGFKIVKTNRFHILSALSYSFNENENKAAKFTKFDSILKLTPLAKHSNNLIFKCQKL